MKIIEKKKKKRKKMVPDLDLDPDFKILPVAHLNFY